MFLSIPLTPMLIQQFGLAYPFGKRLRLPGGRYWLYLFPMTTNSTPGRRQLDGPIRRVQELPVTPQPILSEQPDGRLAKYNEPVPIGFSSRPVSDDIPEPISPIYEYHKPKQRHIKKKLLIILAIIVLATIGWFGFKAIQAAQRIIGSAGSGAPALAGAIDPTKLKGEGDGRINILVLGVGGAGHDGPDLSDTMMVWSIDPKTKDVAMLSVPRDLYVKIPASVKNRSQFGKINSANALGGPSSAEKVIENIIGVPIHYYVVVDFSGFKQAIDAVGGVDINVKQALFDNRYPCETGNKYCPYNQPAGRVHMSGIQALRYARCRHNDAGIGNCGNDYGRASRQQEVIAALRQKALSAGTLTNPIKLTGLINAIGEHVKTDLQIGELKKLAAIAKDIDPSKIVNKVLDDSPDSFLVGGVNIIPVAGYIYVPKSGVASANYFDYSDIQDFVKNIFVDHYLTDENARLEIQNGSGVAGLAGRLAQSLKLAHYNVMSPVNAPGITEQTVIFDYTSGKKPYTINYLEKRFGVKAVKANLPQTVSPSPVATSSSSASTSPTPASPEIRIILGSNYQSTIKNGPTPVN